MNAVVLEDLQVRAPEQRAPTQQVYDVTLWFHCWI